MKYGFRGNIHDDSKFKIVLNSIIFNIKQCKILNMKCFDLSIRNIRLIIINKDVCLKLPIVKLTVK